MAKDNLPLIGKVLSRILGTLSENNIYDDFSFMALCQSFENNPALNNKLVEHLKILKNNPAQLGAYRFLSQQDLDRVTLVNNVQATLAAEQTARAEAEAQAKAQADAEAKRLAKEQADKLAALKEEAARQKAEGDRKVKEAEQAKAKAEAEAARHDAARAAAEKKQKAADNARKAADAEAAQQAAARAAVEKARKQAEAEGKRLAKEESDKLEAAKAEVERLGEVAGKIFEESALTAAMLSRTRIERDDQGNSLQGALVAVDAEAKRAAEAEVALELEHKARAADAAASKAVTEVLEATIAAKTDEVGLSHSMMGRLGTELAAVQSNSIALGNRLADQTTMRKLAEAREASLNITATEANAALVHTNTALSRTRIERDDQVNSLHIALVAVDAEAKRAAEAEAKVKALEEKIAALNAALATQKAETDTQATRARNAEGDLQIIQARAKEAENKVRHLETLRALTSNVTCAPPQIHLPSSNYDHSARPNISTNNQPCTHLSPYALGFGMHLPDLGVRSNGNSSLPLASLLSIFPNLSFAASSSAPVALLSSEGTSQDQLHSSSRMLLARLGASYNGTATSSGYMPSKELVVYNPPQANKDIGVTSWPHPESPVCRPCVSQTFTPILNASSLLLGNANAFALMSSENFSPCAPVANAVKVHSSLFALPIPEASEARSSHTTPSNIPSLSAASITAAIPAMPVAPLRDTSAHTEKYDNIAGPNTTPITNNQPCTYLLPYALGFDMHLPDLGVRSNGNSSLPLASLLSILPNLSFAASSSAPVALLSSEGTSQDQLHSGSIPFAFQVPGSSAFGLQSQSRTLVYAPSTSPLAFLPGFLKCFGYRMLLARLGASYNGTATSSEYMPSKELVVYNPPQANKDIGVTPWPHPESPVCWPCVSQTFTPILNASPLLLGNANAFALMSSENFSPCAPVANAVKVHSSLFALPIPEASEARSSHTTPSNIPSLSAASITAAIPAMPVAPLRDTSAHTEKGNNNSKETIIHGNGACITPPALARSLSLKVLPSTAGNLTNTTVLSLLPHMFWTVATPPTKDTTDDKPPQQLINTTPGQLRSTPGAKINTTAAAPVDADQKRAITLPWFSYFHILWPYTPTRTTDVTPPPTEVTETAAYAVHLTAHAPSTPPSAPTSPASFWGSSPRFHSPTRLHSVRTAGHREEDIQIHVPPLHLDPRASLSPSPRNAVGVTQSVRRSRTIPGNTPRLPQTPSSVERTLTRASSMPDLLPPSAALYDASAVRQRTVSDLAHDVIDSRPHSPVMMPAVSELPAALAPTSLDESRGQDTAASESPPLSSSHTLVATRFPSSQAVRSNPTTFFLLSPTAYAQIVYITWHGPNMRPAPLYPLLPRFGLPVVSASLIVQILSPSTTSMTPVSTQPSWPSIVKPAALGQVKFLPLVADSKAYKSADDNEVWSALERFSFTSEEANRDAGSSNSGGGGSSSSNALSSPINPPIPRLLLPSPPTQSGVIHFIQDTFFGDPRYDTQTHTMFAGLTPRSHSDTERSNDDSDTAASGYYPPVGLGSTSTPTSTTSDEGLRYNTYRGCFALHAHLSMEGAHVCHTSVPAGWDAQNSGFHAPALLTNTEGETMHTPHGRPGATSPTSQAPAPSKSPSPRLASQEAKIETPAVISHRIAASIERLTLAAREVSQHPTASPRLSLIIAEVAALTTAASSPSAAAVLPPSIPEDESSSPVPRPPTAKESLLRELAGLRTTLADALISGDKVSIHLQRFYSARAEFSLRAAELLLSLKNQPNKSKLQRLQTSLTAELLAIETALHAGESTLTQHRQSITLAAQIDAKLAQYKIEILNEVLQTIGQRAPNISVQRERYITFAHISNIMADRHRLCIAIFDSIKQRVTHTESIDFTISIYNEHDVLVLQPDEILGAIALAIAPLRSFDLDVSSMPDFTAQSINIALTIQSIYSAFHNAVEQYNTAEKHAEELAKIRREEGFNVPRLALVGLESSARYDVRLSQNTALMLVCINFMGNFCKEQARFHQAQLLGRERQQEAALDAQAMAYALARTQLHGDYQTQFIDSESLGRSTIEQYASDQLKLLAESLRASTAQKAAAAEAQTAALARQQAIHAEAVRKLKADHAAIFEALQQGHVQELEHSSHQSTTLMEDHKTIMAQMTKNHNDELCALRDKHEQTTEKLRAQYEDKLQRAQQQEDIWRARIVELETHNIDLQLALGASEYRAICYQEAALRLGGQTTARTLAAPPTITTAYPVTAVDRVLAIGPPPDSTAGTASPHPDAASSESALPSELQDRAYKAIAQMEGPAIVIGNYRMLVYLLPPTLRALANEFLASAPWAPTALYAAVQISAYQLAWIAGLPVSLTISQTLIHSVAPFAIQEAVIHTASSPGPLQISASFVLAVLPAAQLVIHHYNPAKTLEPVAVNGYGHTVMWSNVLLAPLSMLKYYVQAQPGYKFDVADDVLSCARYVALGSVFVTCVATGTCISVATTMPLLSRAVLTANLVETTGFWIKEAVHAARSIFVEPSDPANPSDILGYLTNKTPIAHETNDHNRAQFTGDSHGKTTPHHELLGVVNVTTNELG